MSRVAKKSLPLPAGVEVRVAASQVEVKGPKGTLTQALPTGISLQIENKALTLDYDTAQSAMAGTMRALLGHMVLGVSKGFERKLELVGVGYRAQMQGKTLNLTLGFSHPVSFEAPAGITLEAPTQTEVWVKGFDKQLVGEVAAKIRAYRPPEPYKGKGVRYAGERITIKEAKKTK